MDASNAALVKRPWSPEEDEALVAAVGKYGASRWAMIATQLSTGRVGKQCRERWNNHLCPEVKKSEWSEAEDRAIMEGVAVLGTRWCEIVKAPPLSGRTDNAIKNRFYCLQRKMRAKQTGQVERSRPGENAPAPEPMSRVERIMYVARELAFATDEFDRDVLIEQLTATLHEDVSDEALSATDAELVSALSAEKITAEFFDADTAAPFGAMPVEAEKLADFLGAQLSPTKTNVTKLSAAKLGASTKLGASMLPDDQASLETASLPDLTDDSSAASTGSRSPTSSPRTTPAAEHPSAEAPHEDDSPLFEALDELEALCEPRDEPQTREPDAASELTARPPMADNKRDERHALGTTAAVLGGRLAHKALLAPLRVPLNETAATDSPKRMRTPDGSWLSTTPTNGAASFQARRPSALGFGRSPLHAARPSPLARESSASSASTASPTGAREASPPRAVTGTEEPGTVRGAAASLTTGTKEPGAASPLSIMDADAFTLDDFSDLLFSEADLVPASCGKRKAAREWL